MSEFARPQVGQPVRYIDPSAKGHRIGPLAGIILQVDVGNPNVVLNLLVWDRLGQSFTTGYVSFGNFDGPHCVPASN